MQKKAACFWKGHVSCVCQLPGLAFSKKRQPALTQTYSTSVKWHSHFPLFDFPPDPTGSVLEANARHRHALGACGVEVGARQGRLGRGGVGAVDEGDRPDVSEPHNGGVLLDHQGGVPGAARAQRTRTGEHAPGSHFRRAPRANAHSLDSAGATVASPPLFLPPLPPCLPACLSACLPASLLRPPPASLSPPLSTAGPSHMSPLAVSATYPRVPTRLVPGGCALPISMTTPRREASPAVPLQATTEREWSPEAAGARE